MKKGLALLLSAAMIASALAACGANDAGEPPASAEETAGNAETEIRALLTSCRNALANSSPEEVVENYTADGVVMGPGSPAARGEALSAAYAAIFDNVGLDLDFTPADIIIGEKYAFVQSTSDGTASIKASGETVPEQNRELFVMEKADGAWKIARYMYNKMDAFAVADKTTVTENTAAGSADEDERQVRELIESTYRNALAAGDAEAAANAFASDGVVMPPEGATYRGSEAVKENYEGIFKAVALDLQFDIDEIVLDGDYGFVRSTSDGTAKVLADKTSGPEVNRTLWVVRKEKGRWKIAFYMYNKMS